MKKKMYLILLVTVFVGGTVVAQEKAEIGKKKNARIEMKKALNLSEDQQIKIKAFDQEHKLKMQELNKEHRQKISSVLTDEQKSKMKELRADNKMKKEQHFKRWDKNKNARTLNFDSETINKLKALRENYKKEVQSVELSRIAPEAQTKEKEELKEKYKVDRKKVISEAKEMKK